MPAMTSTTTTDMEPKGIALMRTSARPVPWSAVPRAKPPATSQRTVQLISLMSSLVKMPVQVRTASGMRATMLELMPVSCSVAHRRMVPAKVIHTTVVFQSFLRLLSGMRRVI